MGTQIKSIDLFVRNISPPRMDFAIGKGQSLFPEWMRVNLEVRLVLESDEGKRAFGCSADWPSFGWLDKRPDVAPKAKFVELLELVDLARQTYLSNASSASAFDCWWKTQADFLSLAQVQSSVPLCCSFALALIERALIDATCRLEGMTFHECLRKNRLGFQPDRIHDELKGFAFADCLPELPLDRVHIRHTIGPSDPLTDDDIGDGARLMDGRPHTLKEYLTRDGISFFKIKICGDRERDLNRLARIWDVIKGSHPVITLDGNEAYDDVAEFGELVKTLSKQQSEMFERIRYIEQPMNRSATHDSSLKSAIEAISSLKPLIIDEADGTLKAFADATEIGYRGVSHKNCKGIFKSLANFALCESRNRNGGAFFLSAEDLTSMPTVALQQDFAVIASLGLTHAERNGHHFFLGLSHLSKQEKRDAISNHQGLYEECDGQVFLSITEGQVDISSLQVNGLGISSEPDWATLATFETWLEEFRTKNSASS